MILHALHYHDREVDFMIGAQLKGFKNMVHLTEENDFMLLEGDEYLSSAIDRRPKFHLYHPNIALLSGIAWDHINVFPTLENYVEQFETFVETMEHGSVLVYNEEDETLKSIAEKAEKPVRKHPYRTPQYRIQNGTTLLDTPEGEMPLEIFGKHNLNNLAGAKWVCQFMGIDEADFYEAIATFEGASKRLEKIADSDNTVIFKDYAHSPSKVEATTKAVKNQYQDKKLIACFELHTYSSLDSEFLSHYKNTLNAADEAVIFYSPKAIKIKGLKNIEPQDIRDAFQHKNVRIFTEGKEFVNYLKTLELKDAVLLLMSSGNYGGLDFDELKDWV
jgi:UDP-N-acetylmuramate: L-alanyl-gamma-D-glutamyl-meso-diaminopimelate ligase